MILLICQKVKMDESGNIFIKRLSKSGVYVKNTVDESAVSNDLLKLKDGMVDLERVAGERMDACF